MLLGLRMAWRLYFEHMDRSAPYWSEYDGS